MNIYVNPGFQAPPKKPEKQGTVLEKGISDIQKKREGTLLEQFANTREMLKGQQTEAKRGAQNSLQRFAAISGIGSGAAEKAKQEAERNIDQGYAQTSAGLAAQEAAAKDQLAASEQGLLQQQQMLDFQKDSFAQQMKFQWAEFDENLKTNLINGAVALKNAGLNSPKAWTDLATVTGRLYGGNRVNFDLMAYGSNPSQNKVDFMRGKQ